MMFERWPLETILTLVGLSILFSLAIPLMVQEARKRHRAGELGWAALSYIFALQGALVVLVLWLLAMGIDVRDYFGIQHR